MAEKPTGIELFGAQFKQKRNPHFQYAPLEMEHDGYTWKLIVNVLFNFGNGPFEPSEIVAAVFKDMQDFSETHFGCTFEVEVSGGSGLSITCTLRGNLS